MKKTRLLSAALLLALLSATSLFGQVINEYVAQHSSNGTGNRNDREYIEVFGTANTDLSNLYIIQVNGNAGNEGIVDSIHQLGTTNADGYYWTGFLDSVLSNSTMTLILVSNFTGSLSMDLDTNNDGTFNVTPWDAILDSVGIQEAGETVYSPVALTRNYDGINYLPAGASRIPNGIDTDAVGDWIRNDWDGEGLTGFSGSLSASEAINTPNTENANQYPPASPIINEFVADHIGSDTFEYIEVFGNATIDYSSTTLLVLEGDQAENPGEIDNVFPVGTTNGSGFWTTGYQADQLENGTLTILIVSAFTGSAGDDLDTNDDGTLDTTPWTELFDAVSIRDADAADPTYAGFTLLSPLSTSGANGGASRIPNGTDTDLAADWVFNDYEGDGLPGFSTSAGNDEAINTHRSTNRTSQGNYYNNVDASSQANLRQSLHNVIKDHTRFPYTASSTDVWDILELADQDANDASKVICVYKNVSYDKFGGGSGPYNREHTWPKSYGFSDYNDCNYPYTDCHHLMISDVQYNSNRGNLFFDNCSSGCTGDDALYNASNDWGGNPADVNLRDGNSYEVWPERRGDVARAQFYMDIRYEGGTHGITGCNEPDLVLTDNAALINTGSNYMGLLSVLIQWHNEDPVDDIERLRNEVVYSFQGNRNPFVDHPEWVDCLYNGNCDIDVLTCVMTHFPEWSFNTGAGCPIETATSIRTYISMVNGSCECSP
jgi:endonuclease I